MEERVEPGADHDSLGQPGGKATADSGQNHCQSRGDAAEVLLVVTKHCKLKTHMYYFPSTKLQLTITNLSITPIPSICRWFKSYFQQDKRVNKTISKGKRVIYPPLL